MVNTSRSTDDDKLTDPAGVALKEKADADLAEIPARNRRSNFMVVGESDDGMDGTYGLSAMHGGGWGVITERLGEDVPPKCTDGSSASIHEKLSASLASFAHVVIEESLVVFSDLIHSSQ